MTAKKKSGHPFDTRKDEAAYWLRDKPEDLVEHRRRLKNHEDLRRAQQKETKK
jgi:hypothetical protein